MLRGGGHDGGLLLDKTRPSVKTPLSQKVRLEVLAKTVTETPAPMQSLPKKRRHTLMLSNPTLGSR